MFTRSTGFPRTSNSHHFTLIESNYRSPCVRVRFFLFCHYVPLDKAARICYTSDMDLYSLADTPLPEGYSQNAMVVRRFLLDLRLRLDRLPLDRKLMLERKINEFHTDGKRRRKGNSFYAGPDSRETNAYLLAKSVTG